MQDVRGLRLRASGLETLRAIAGAGARPLGHDAGPDYAFLAVDAARGYEGVRELTRSFVFLPGLEALIAYDIAAPGTAVKWVAEGADKRDSVGTVSAAESSALHVIQTGKAQAIGKIESDDLAGVRLAQHVVAFHTETRMAQSAVSFEVAGPPELKFLITGLAPGLWEIWRAGMLEISDSLVAPEAGALHFAGKPGSYFLRHV
jgi:hypothetical protein